MRFCIFYVILACLTPCLYSDVACQAGSRVTLKELCELLYQDVDSAVYKNFIKKCPLILYKEEQKIELSSSLTSNHYLYRKEIAYGGKGFIVRTEERGLVKDGTYTVTVKMSVNGVEVLIDECVESRRFGIWKDIRGKVKLPNKPRDPFGRFDPPDMDYETREYLGGSSLQGSIRTISYEQILSFRYSRDRLIKLLLYRDSWRYLEP